MLMLRTVYFYFAVTLLYNCFHFQFILIISSLYFRGILVIIHGLNEHSGRYLHFAELLTSCGFGVYAMDWIGEN
jgi:hypothetical protein